MSAEPRGTTVADTARAALAASLDAEIERQRADGSIPGLALAITDREALFFERTYGFAEAASRSVVGPRTLFEIGSIGKTFTALVILQLADEGRLRLDDPVIRHLPWFRVPRTGERITLHHLLSHTAGITAGIDGTPEATFQVWRLRDLAPGSAPGRRFHYSNVGYKALGLVIEAIEGTTYATAVQRRILEPLGMTDTIPAITNDERDRLAVGYGPARDDRRWTEGEPLHPATWLETGTADGSIASTATDMAIFLRALMRDQRGHVAVMSAPVPARAAEGYGYGLFRRTIAGRTYLGHPGGMVGFTAGLAWDPDEGIGAVVLQNGPGHGPNALSRMAIRRARAVRDGRDPEAERPEDLSALRGHSDSPTWTQPTAAQAVVTGVYRSHDPWLPVIRVEALGDDLWLTLPAGADGFEPEQPLVPMARGRYRVGADRLGPERLRFDTVIEGRARRAWLSGWDYYRVDPP